VVTIATPPHLHAEVSKLFLSKGIDVICEKSLTRTLEEAIELERFVAERPNRLFMVTHCYTGYPLVREAQALVRDGAIDDVRQVECDFPSGPFMTENSDRNRRHWRFRPEFMGKEAIFGEVGAHTISMAQFVSGKTPIAVSASMSILTEGRETFDDAHLPPICRGRARPNAALVRRGPTSLNGAAGRTVNWNSNAKSTKIGLGLNRHRLTKTRRPIRCFCQP
jgi:predicted dehydrogenase